MKSFFTLIILGMVLYTSAHEEPPKTLYEKKQKSEVKQKIAASGIQSMTLYKLSEIGSGRERMMKMNYDTDGTYHSVETFVDEKPDIRVEYGYSWKGDMISDSDFDNSGQLLEKNKFRYDKKGRVISGKSFEKNVLSGTFTFIHSRDKKMIDFLKFTPDNRLDYKLSYRYQDDYDIQDYSEVKKILADGSTEMTVIKEYNISNKVVRKSIFGSEGKLSFYFEYTYDDQGNNIKISKISSDAIMEKYDLFFFDPGGSITKRETYNQDNGLVSVIINEYQYFENK